MRKIGSPVYLVLVCFTVKYIDGLDAIILGLIVFFDL